MAEGIPWGLCRGYPQSPGTCSHPRDGLASLLPPYLWLVLVLALTVVPGEHVAISAWVRLWPDRFPEVLFPSPAVSLPGCCSCFIRLRCRGNAVLVFFPHFVLYNFPHGFILLLCVVCEFVRIHVGARVPVKARG